MHDQIVENRNTRINSSIQIAKRTEQILVTPIMELLLEDSEPQSCIDELLHILAYLKNLTQTHSLSVTISLLESKLTRLQQLKVDIAPRNSP